MLLAVQHRCVLACGCKCALSCHFFSQKDTAEIVSKAKAPLADIRRYLKATGLIELRHIRKLSSLCAQTYYIKKLTVRLQWFALLEIFCVCAAVSSAPGRLRLHSSAVSAF